MARRVRCECGRHMWVENDYAGNVKCLCGAEFGASARSQPGDGGTANKPQPSRFCVTLLNTGTNDVAVRRLVREACRVGLAESKRLVEGAPVRLIKALTKPDADALCKTLLASGASAIVEQAAWQEGKLRVHCAKCGRVFRIAPTVYGKSGPCAGCGTTILLDEASVCCG